MKKKKIPEGLLGPQILNDPLLNKGTAFTEEERLELGLDGLLPTHISTLEEQVKRRYANFKSQPSPLSKYTFLNALQNRNNTLFYRFVLEHVNEMVPLIYTPTVGEVSTDFSLLYKEQRGLYLSYSKRDRIEQMVANFPRSDIDVIVITDGERILGLGDLGVGGMAIPIGKLALYTLFGGIHPERTLPIVLDVGCNNPKLLEDPLYLGWRNERIEGDEYYDFVDQCITAIKKRFPNVLLQWEDFAKPHAQPLLKKYRESLCSFNDDIQGTASVALAAVYSALKLSKGKLKEQRFAVLGGGSAGIGICDQLVNAIVADGEITKEEAQKLFYVVDLHGLLQSEAEHYNASQRPYCHSQKALASWKIANPAHITLLEVIENAKPSVLIGVSTQGGAFTEEIIRAMNKHTPRPMIFPLSNPTSRSEATPSNLIKWTKGEAIIATGSPFEPVAHEGHLHKIAQCNNVYIFPGVGLGLIATKASYVSDQVFINAAKVLSEHSPMLTDPYAPLFPTLDTLREVTRKIGINVAETILEEGHNTVEIDSVEKSIDEAIWFPEYPIYTR